LNKVQVSQHLKLLAYLRSDVMVLRMLFGELSFKGIHVVERESRVEPLDASQDIGDPTPDLRFSLQQLVASLPLVKHGRLRANCPVLNDANPSQGGYAGQRNHAPFPSGSPSGWTERFPPNQAAGGDARSVNELEVGNHPSSRIIAQ
jgi:hypothetical protein